MISFVVVLPALPVIATTLAPDRAPDLARRAAAAPTSVSGTAMTAAPVPARSPSRRRPTITSRRRPRRAAIASSTNAWPSKRSPRSATNSAPAASDRVSVETRGERRSGGRRRPGGRRWRRPPARRSARAPPRAPVTRVTRARRSTSAARATSTSSNGSVRSPMTWYFSWPLPAMMTRSPGFGGADRLLDRQAPIGIGRRTASRTLRRARLGRRHEAALDLFDDPERILRARVVGRQHDEIAQPRGDGAHQRPLGAIAIAAAAEDGDEPALGERPRRLEQILAARRRCARSRRRRARRRSRPRRSGTGRARARGARCPASIAWRRAGRARRAAATTPRML